MTDATNFIEQFDQFLGLARTDRVRVSLSTPEIIQLFLGHMLQFEVERIADALEERNSD